MHKQLTSEERYYIATCLRQGITKNQIAKQFNRSHTTITREIARNTGGRDKHMSLQGKGMALRINLSSSTIQLKS